MNLINFNKKNIYIGKSPKNYGKTYFAKRNFKKGEVVLIMAGKKIFHQTKCYSVQISMNEHFSPSQWTGKYFNHSCEPNCFIHSKMKTLNLIAMKSISLGDELTFAYWMTEYKWTKIADENKIKCKCGSKSCKGKIFSFSQLSDLEKKKYKKYLSKYLQKI